MIKTYSGSYNQITNFFATPVAFFDKYPILILKMSATLSSIGDKRVIYQKQKERQ